MEISFVEAALMIGTFGICTGVWVTLKVIIDQGKVTENICICDHLESVPMTIIEKKEENN